jgi:ADP-heptose:LPS heptosyltransferase
VACRDAPEAYRADIVCNPDELPCYLELDSPTSHKTHVALPARYYLEMEMRLGVRLPRDDNFVPTYHYVAPAPFRTNLLVCYVSATSLPEKKDYGKDRYREVASALSANLVPRSVRHFHIGSHYEAASTRPPLEEIEVATIDDAGRLFATADLVIGNDTGLTHLAALSLGRGREAQVVGLYGRHSYAKWNTGRSNHHAIATVFSQWMKAADLCPVRDEIDDSVYGDAANLASIIPSYIAEVAAALLDQR